MRVAWNTIKFAYYCNITYLFYISIRQALSLQMYVNNTCTKRDNCSYFEIKMIIRNTWLKIAGVVISQFAACIEWDIEHSCKYAWDVMIGSKCGHGANVAGKDFKVD